MKIILLYLDHDVLVFMPRDALVVWNYRNQHLRSETLVLILTFDGKNGCESEFSKSWGPCVKCWSWYLRLKWL